jgi:hypothetical protein
MAARNALKHGLLARSAVITLGPAKENKAEFEQLLSGLQEYFAPVGTAEELLVEEIAVCYWMERRAQLYENFQICTQAGLPSTPERKPWKELGYDKGDEDEQWIHNHLKDSEGYMLLRRSEGVAYVLRTVARFRDGVKNKGECDQYLIEELAEICGGYWETLDLKDAQATFQTSELLAQLDKEKEKLELLRKKLEEKPPRSRRPLPNVSHAALLLEPKNLDLLQRYTAAHERRRYRALAQLERLQRQRTGEVIPPPIHVQITGDAEDSTKRSQ